MTAFIRQSSLSLLLLLCLLGHNSAFSHGEKADWIHVGGNVDFEGIPLCALVLINGQSQFSCDGNGRYDMEVPADQNGMITVQVFVDGFAPFNQIVTPDQAAAYPVAMVQDQGSPSLDVGATYEPSATEGRLIVSGSITIGGAPVCALVLANGVSMFSCGGAGQYSLDVPLDQDGNVTLMVFAAGFKPFKDTIFDAELLNGTYDGVSKKPPGYLVFFPIDSAKTSFDISGTKITITADAFFAGLCEFSGDIIPSFAPLSAAGTYRCEDFSEGTWTSSLIARTPGNTFLAVLNIDNGGGTYVAKYIGFLTSGSTISGPGYFYDSGDYRDLAGRYDGNMISSIAGRSPTDTTIEITGNDIYIVQDAFFEGVCRFSGTIDNTSVVPLSASGTYECSNFDEGTWTSTNIVLTGVDSFFAALTLEVPARGDSYTVKYIGFK
jgi:hypothetical protein